MSTFTTGTNDRAPDPPLPTASQGADFMTDTELAAFGAVLESDPKAAGTWRDHARRVRRSRPVAFTEAAGVQSSSTPLHRRWPKALLWAGYATAPVLLGVVLWYGASRLTASAKSRPPHELANAKTSRSDGLTAQSRAKSLTANVDYTLSVKHGEGWLKVFVLTDTGADLISENPPPTSPDSEVVFASYKVLQQTGVAYELIVETDKDSPEIERSITNWFAPQSGKLGMTLRDPKFIAEDKDGSNAEQLVRDACRRLPVSWFKVVVRRYTMRPNVHAAEADPSLR